jgi:DNA modification methylase
VSTRKSSKLITTQQSLIVDPSPSEVFVTIEEASRLTGYLVDRLRAMVRRKTVPYRGSQRDPVISMATVERLREGSRAVWLETLPGPPGRRRVGEGEASKFTFNRVVEGNVIDVVKTMPARSVQAIITSPPFWGQRVYADEKPVLWQDGTTVAFGREPTPDGYVAHTLEILAALARVLKPQGTIWWNLGDSYMTRAIARTSSRDRISHYAGKRTTWADNPYRRFSSRHAYLKDKDLTLVPFQIAIGAQHVGYWVRSVIVWSKQHTAVGSSQDAGTRAHVPEVVTDRPVVGHEYILLLTRSDRYTYYGTRAGDVDGDGTAINVRSVWTFKPVGKGGEHGARFPVQLPRRCIQLGTRRGQTVFDPFAGEGNTLVAAKALGRPFFGCDISPTYVTTSRRILGLEEQPD